MTLLSRIAACLLLFLLGSGPVAPVLAASANAQSCRMACCKRSGAASCSHHRGQGGQVPAWQASPSCGSACSQIALQLTPMPDCTGALAPSSTLPTLSSKAGPPVEVSNSLATLAGTELFERPPPSSLL